ncbi:MAG: 50S ribosomal protein L31 [Deltaproteobacteria bacterium]|nr:50S ribosomal protein L31 [Deltaproteobacteria bacterium]
MKKNIHPSLKKAQVKCACGNTFETLSVKEKINVDICAKCHPIFTGKEKIVDSTGQVERFEKRYKKR